jgi:DNA-binding response OmpR family regulator
VAMDLEMILRGAGYVVVGPATRLAQAMSLAEQEDIDGAVLDVNLGGEHVFGVAEVLARRNVPFVFVTGYDRNILPDELAQRPLVRKPYVARSILTKLQELFRSLAEVPNSLGIGMPHGAKR